MLPLFSCADPQQQCYFPAYQSTPQMQAERAATRRGLPQVLTQLAQHIALEQQASQAVAAAAAGPLSVRVLTAAPSQGPHSGALLGDPMAQLALSIAVAAPWLLAHRMEPAAQVRSLGSLTS